MLFSEILKKLSDDITVEEVREYGKDSQIYAVAPLRENLEFRHDVLYVADPSCEWKEGRVPPNVLWLGKMAEYLEPMTGSCAKVRTELDSASVIDKIGEIIIDEQKCQQFRIKMMNILMSGSGLDGLLDDICKTLDVSVIVMSLSGKIWAVSHPFLIGDLMWAESARNGYCPPFFIEYLKKVRAKSTSDRNSIIFSRCQDSKLYYLAKRLYAEDGIFGYIFMMQYDKNFDPLCNEAISFVEQAVMRSVGRGKNGVEIKSGLYGDLVVDMLNSASPEQIVSRIQTGELRFPAKMCVAAMRPKYFKGDNYIKDILLDKLQQMFPQEIIVSYQNLAVVVFALQKGEAFMNKDVLEQLESLCDQENLTVGISNPYSKVVFTKHFFEQSTAALALARKLDIKGDVHLYRDLSIYDVIDKLPQDVKPAFFCHPAIAILREYDAQNGTQLCETLEAYVDNGFNQNLTASSLYLHRNTLAYRKQKIISLTGVDLEDIETQYLLHFSMVIERYLQKTKF